MNYCPFDFLTSTTKLTFNISLAGADGNRTLVGNLGRNIIRKLVVKLEGNEIISIDDYDILYSYYDCWKCTTERLTAVFQGIVEADGQMENAIKHRINASDKANDAKDQTVASIHDNHFCILLDFEILESSTPLYQSGLDSRLTYELTFASYSDVIKATNSNATYTISRISLEFDTVINASLASQIRTEYMKSSILYDRILRARIIPLNDSSTSFSVDINSPSKSLKGVLLIFTKERSATKFSRDTEEFFNPKITKVEVTVEGVPNELYAQNMGYKHQYDEIAGTNRYHYSFSSMCVSKTWLFVTWKILGVSKNLAFDLCLTNQNFLTFTALSVIFQILSNFPKDFQRTSLADSSNGSWSRADSQTMSESSRIKIWIYRNRAPL